VPLARTSTRPSRPSEGFRLLLSAAERMLICAASGLAAVQRRTAIENYSRAELGKHCDPHLGVGGNCSLPIH